MNDSTELELRGLYLRVDWLWDPAEPEVGHFNEYFSVETVCVFDDQGNEFEIVIDEKFQAEIEDALRKKVERDRHMDREP